jgi:hypothetical protein
MKRIFTLYFFCFCILHLTFPAHAQNFLWGRSGGSIENSDNSFNRESLYDIATDRNGNVYIIAPVKKFGLNIAGQPLTGYGSSDIMLASFKPDGSFRWAKLIGTGGFDYCDWLGTDDKDGVYFSGTVDKSDGVAHIDVDAVSPKNNQARILVKYDTAGKFQWYKHPEPDTLSTWGGSSISYGMDVDNAGNVYWLMRLLPGLYGGTLNVITEGTYILKYSASGSFSYIKPDIEAISGMAFPLSIGVTIDEANNRFYLSGSRAGADIKIGGQPLTGSMYIGAFKIDGSLLWKKENTAGTGGFNGRAAIDNKGNIYLAGGGNSQGSSGATVFNGYTLTQGGVHGTPLVMKMDKDGNHLWAREGNINAATGVRSIALFDNTQVMVTGDFPGLLEWPGSGVPGFNSPQNYGYDVYITRFDINNGSVLGMDRMSSSFGVYERPSCMATDGNGHVYIGGYIQADMFVNQSDTLTSTGGDQDWFVVKYGYMWPASIEENISASQVKIYPNPAKDQLIIEAAKAGSTISVFNMVGQQVYEAKTLNGNKVVDVSGLPIGNYIVQLIANDGSRINRKILKQ